MQRAWGKETFCKKFPSPKPPSFKNFWQGGGIVHPADPREKKELSPSFRRRYSTSLLISSPTPQLQKFFEKGVWGKNFFLKKFF
ncbi:MAG: hypothetical protein LBR56_06100, partial [Sporomusaceae bacterium]|nr:hypothetical protein [Sporomusaceae bacterium]